MSKIAGLAAIKTDAAARSAEFYVTDASLDVKVTLDKLAKKNALVADWSFAN